MKLASLTAEVNSNYRKDLHRLSPDVRLTASNAGEAKALYAIAAAKRIVMLKSAGLSPGPASGHTGLPLTPTDLPADMLLVYRTLEGTETRLKKQVGAISRD